MLPHLNSGCAPSASLSTLFSSGPLVQSAAAQTVPSYYSQLNACQYMSDARNISPTSRLLQDSPCMCAAFCNQQLSITLTNSQVDILQQRPASILVCLLQCVHGDRLLALPQADADVAPAVSCEAQLGSQGLNRSSLHGTGLTAAQSRGLICSCCSFMLKHTPAGSICLAGAQAPEGTATGWQLLTKCVSLRTPVC